jgi:peptidoglycan LD-endopeptidase LytH
MYIASGDVPTSGPMGPPKKSESFRPLKTADVSFHPAIQLPSEYEVYDFTQGYDPDRTLSSQYGVGRYDERRPGMYAGEQFQEDQRDIHVGVDIAAPVGEPVYAFYGGTIFKLGDNALPYDYGPTIITRHRWLEQTVYALHGHLDRSSLTRWSVGDTFSAGALLARVGSQSENGGWNPHLHFQLCLFAPETHDLPGVVCQRDRLWARAAFPDPRLVLGPLYA